MVGVSNPDTDTFGQRTVSDPVSDTVSDTTRVSVHDQNCSMPQLSRTWVESRSTLQVSLMRELQIWLF